MCIEYEIMSKKVLILHGWGGSSYPHWQAHLAMDLIKLNYTVSFPSLPHKDLPKLKDWMKYLKKELEHFKPDIVICHSLGNILWFQIEEELNLVVEKLLLVAPVRINCEIKELNTFFPYTYPKDLKTQKAYLIASSNDPYLNEEEAKNLQKELNIPMTILKDAGHINADSGYGPLELALKFITKENNNNV